MHSKERGETADGYCDSVFYKSGKELYEEHDFVSGTDLPVEENEIARTGQVPDRNVPIVNELSLAQWHDCTEVQAGRVHKYTA